MAADFFSRMLNKANSDKAIHRQLEAFYSTLSRIDRRDTSLFEYECLRSEEKASALPSKPRFLRRLGINQIIAIRLYCFPVGRRTLILFNGDVKTNDDPTLCPQVSSHFHLALGLARKLEQIVKQWEVNSDGIIICDTPEIVF